MDSDGPDSRVLDGSQYNVTKKFKGTSKMVSGWYATISVTQLALLMRLGCRSIERQQRDTCV